MIRKLDWFVWDLSLKFDALPRPLNWLVFIVKLCGNYARALLKYMPCFLFFNC
jgi:hypothetical protein